jgi:hypothetical protein
MMDEPARPPRIAVTDAWRNEQQAKRDAYEAKRRGWMRGLERGLDAEADAGEDEVPAPGGQGVSGSVAPDPAIAPARRSRWGGMVHDVRQTRFTF